MLSLVKCEHSDEAINNKVIVEKLVDTSSGKTSIPIDIKLGCKIFVGFYKSFGYFITWFYFGSYSRLCSSYLRFTNVWPLGTIQKYIWHYCF